MTTMGSAQKEAVRASTESGPVRLWIGGASGYLPT